MSKAILTWGENTLVHLKKFNSSLQTASWKVIGNKGLSCIIKKNAGCILTFAKKHFGNQKVSSTLVSICSELKKCPLRSRMVGHAFTCRFRCQWWKVVPLLWEQCHPLRVLLSSLRNTLLHLQCCNTLLRVQLWEACGVLWWVLACWWFPSLVASTKSNLQDNN